MTISEKAAYLKGLVEGQGLDPEAGEGKLWRVLSELIGDITEELNALRDDHEDLAESWEEIEEELDFLETVLQEDYDEDFEDYEEDDDDLPYYPFGGDYDDETGEEDEEDEDLDEDEDFGVIYEVECPNCGEQISFEDDVLEEGSIFCPACGAVLEFEMTDPDEEEKPDDGE